jgi:DNA-directed RNA polymerase sigma subunit (sigma70/sigma32)
VTPGTRGHLNARPSLDAEDGQHREGSTRLLRISYTDLVEKTDWDYDNPVSIYLREVNALPPLTQDEELELSEHVRAQDEHAEDAGRRLAEANLARVVSIAGPCRDSGSHVLDLVVKGNDGLLLALKTFPGSASTTFSAHAVRCIEDAIKQAVAEGGELNKPTP